MKINFKTIKVPKLFVYIDGNKFSYNYLCEILEGIKNGDGAFSDPKEIEILKTIGLIDYEGSKRSGLAATEGKKFKIIYEKVMNYGG